MALYRYVKAPPVMVTAIPIAPALHWEEHERKTPKGGALSFASMGLMLTGLILLLSVGGPIVYHELVTFPKLSRPPLISPLPVTAQESQSLAQIAGVTTSSGAEALPAATTDYTKASNWFPTAPSAPSKNISYYTIDIPKLKIKNAIVTIGGDDLKRTLVQYSETALPGEFGSAVIFGHSILRQFYNPAETNSNRYLSIFSTIMTLEPGDEIQVHFDGITYTYEVADKYEVEPEQIEVLQQRYDRRTLKLITCVPEGTYLRRGVIEAKLI